MKRPSLRPAPETPRRNKPDPLIYGHVWLLHHWYVIISSMGQIARAPLSTLMTSAVIGIALALPMGLYLLLENVQQISGEWGGNIQISLFLKQEVPENKAHALADHLLQKPDISTVQIITPAEALEEYRTLSGFGEALTTLETNPLPFVLILQLSTQDLSTRATEQLLAELNQIPEVEIAQFDMLWVKRLLAILQLVKRGILLLATFLFLTVVLVIGNTIRLSIYNRREEIEVYKLIGATDPFIRRPFLYLGFWYGLSGGIIAWLLISLSLWILAEPIKQLTAVYYSQLNIIGLDWLSTLGLFTGGSLLGLSGAWLAVNRHLKEINPS